MKETGTELNQLKSPHDLRFFVKVKDSKMGNQKVYAEMCPNMQKVKIKYFTKNRSFADR